ncbi:DeoR family transcriptional regulator [Burkholderia lata]|uniref:DeoR family transcriptional regulator n=1 Tax=Burkholderia lata (strain ATCC 17760 / DSM 23089 / LMG 22485 / NCIMB 9086 / R18194 / 383) TaxID=482957 RepID=A0A6P2Y4G4_BURL3|nr:dienelactone hydrolase family protein [Burkholderia lata]VWD17110.1 DeoR family transcriptional regulator [Burkholderia lata]
MNTNLVRHATRSLLPAIAASVVAACNSPATVSASITNSLEEGRSGIITFASVTPQNTGDYLSHYANSEKAVITGNLSVPGNGPRAVPAVIILHGSSGVNRGERVWAQRMNALGYASFVVDSFTGRGIRNTEKDQTQLSMTADIADAYAALRLLATDPRIDKERIAVMGFSRGGVAALYSSLEPFRLAAGEGNLRFAAHVAFYPSCSISYESAHVDGSPVLMLVGGKDNYTPAARCIAYAETLRSKGVPVTLKEYPDAWHGFDRPTPVHSVPLATSARECQGSYDLDSRKFTMVRDGQTLHGAAAVAESKRCLTTGVILGGDPEAQVQSPTEVATFLRAAFE